MQQNNINYDKLELQGFTIEVARNEFENSLRLSFLSTAIDCQNHLEHAPRLLHKTIISAFADAVKNVLSELTETVELTQQTLTDDTNLFAITNTTKDIVLVRITTTTHTEIVEA